MHSFASHRILKTHWIINETKYSVLCYFSLSAAPRRTRYTSPQSQLIITTVLISVEVIVNGTWLIYNTPKVTHTFPKRDQNILICTGSEDASYLVGLIYPFILICFCTVFAFKVSSCAFRRVICIRTWQASVAKEVEARARIDEVLASNYQ